MFGIASSTAQESMLESILTAQVYAGVSLLTAQLTKCEGVFSNPKGQVFWKSGESSACAIHSKVEVEPRKKMGEELFFHWLFYFIFTRHPWNMWLVNLSGRDGNFIDIFFSTVNPLDVGVVNLTSRGFCSKRWRIIWDWKATIVCADQRFVVHSLSLCWICC